MDFLLVVVDTVVMAEHALTFLLFHMVMKDVDVEEEDMVQWQLEDMVCFIIIVVPTIIEEEAVVEVEDLWTLVEMLLDTDLEEVEDFMEDMLEEEMAEEDMMEVLELLMVLMAFV